MNPQAMQDSQVSYMKTLRECTTSSGQTFYVSVKDSETVPTHHFSKDAHFTGILWPNFFAFVDLAALLLVVCLHLCYLYAKRRTASERAKVDSGNATSTKFQEVRVPFYSAAALGLPGAEAFPFKLGPCPDDEMDAVIDEMNIVARRYRFSKIPFLLFSGAILLVTIIVLSAVGVNWTEKSTTGMWLSMGLSSLLGFKFVAVFNSAQITYNALVIESRRITESSPSLNVYIDQELFVRYLVFPFACVTYMPFFLTIRRKNLSPIEEIKAQTEKV